MVLLEFSMTPLDKGESVSAYVARSLDIVDRSGLPYQLTPMGTIVEGECRGTIATSERGTRGFGFDPLFVPDDGDGRTFAEMSDDEKNTMSHRARAFNELARRLGS